MAVPASIAAALAVAAILFHVKQQVGDLEKELAQVNRTILAHQEAIQVLRTEWSYLNQPARIAELARRHLGMRPLTPSQVIRLEDLPARAAPTDPAGVAAAPDGTTGADAAALARRAAVTTAAPASRAGLRTGSIR